METKAMIFGYILGDGWIDKKGNCGISGDKNSLRIIAEDINKIFLTKLSLKHIVYLKPR